MGLHWPKKDFIDQQIYFHLSADPDFLRPGGGNDGSGPRWLFSHLVIFQKSEAAAF